MTDLEDTVTRPATPPRPAAPTRSVDARVRALTVGAVALISLSAFEALAVATVMPAVAADLDGLTLYAVGFGAPLATGVIGMALAGLWGDARGPRLPLQVGVGLLCLGLLIAGVAPLMPVFVLGRAVQGLGSGMLSVSIYVLVGSVVPEPARPRIFAYFAAAWVLPGMVGPAVAGLILHAAGWRAVFLIVPLLAVPALVLMQPALRVDRAPAPDAAPDRRAAGRRTLLLAAVAGAAAAALQVAGTRTDPLGLAVVLASAGALGWSVPRLLPAGSFRLVRGLPAVIGVRGMVGAAFVGAEAFLPLELVRERGWSPVLAGLVLTTGTVSWSAAAWVQGRVTALPARFRFARLGTALVAAGVLVSLASVLPPVPAALTIAGWAVTGAGMGLVYSSLSLLSLHLTPVERHGEASAALQTSESLASALALALAGAAFALALPAGIGPHAAAGPVPYLAGMSVALLAGVVAALGSWRLNPAS